LIGQLYLLIPWSAINLVDYYVVQRGSYSIDDLYDAQGRYGRWNRKTMIVYAISIIGTVPFMKLSFFEGYFAKLIGADVSWIAGLVLAGFLYCIFSWNRASSATTERARDRQGVGTFANAEE
jgi:NCS1 family nucleobase:cation symporter-1